MKGTPPLLAGLVSSGDEPLTVSELTRQIRRRLEDSFPAVNVVGELSGVHPAASGHVYLTLKDEEAQLRGVIWRTTAAAIRFELAEGLKVVARGELGVYARRGEYQLVIRELVPHGLGPLRLAFEQLKARLEKEGLFAPERKRPLPFLPRTIGLVTSAAGAALHDILQVISRRYPPFQAILRPVPVQGAGAALEIAAGIRDLNEYHERVAPIDVMIVGRGGGSPEDLWAFNEEPVARAAAASSVPIISAVGHEVDVTILDFVADRRALTPSEAGELAVPRLDELLQRQAELARRLDHPLARQLDRARERLADRAQRLERASPPARIRQFQQRLDEAGRRLLALGSRLAAAAGEPLARLADRLQALSPLRVLARGYSVTRRAGDPACLRDVTGLKPGERLDTRLATGSIVSIIERVAPGSAPAAAAPD